MLEITSVSAGYGSLIALENISAKLAKGERLGIFGHNGAGKTTLLRCIIGAHAPSAGSVTFDGEPVEPGNVPATVRRGIAFVPQGHNVFPNLSVEENLTISGLLFDRSFVKEVLRIFPILEERRSQRAGSMSGGEQQMLALGMAMMTSRNGCSSTSPRQGSRPSSCAT